MCLMQTYLETEFLICHIRTLYNAKKSRNTYFNAWCYIQWSHDGHYVEIY
jgi:hypothetical protein